MSSKKISLKLARRLVQELQDLQNQKRQQADFEIQNVVYSSVIDATLDKDHITQRAVAIHQELVSLRYYLRGKIGSANEASGINFLTCELAHLEENVNLPCSARYVVKIRNSAGLIEAAALAPSVRQNSELRLKIADLKDKISVLNSQTTVEVDEHVMQQITAFLGINI